MKKTAQPSARELAVMAFARVRKGANAAEALDGLVRRYAPDPRDAAFASRTVLGVLQNQTLLDFYLSSYSTVKPNKMESSVLDILRTGVYQLLFMDRVPARAAVSESVELAKKAGGRAAGLVNAVLRKIAQAAPDALPEIPGGRSAEALSVRYSHPLWLVEETLAALGLEGAEALLRMNNEPAPVTAQVNMLRVTTEDLIKSLRESEIDAVPHAFLPDCVEFQLAGDIAALEAFRRGWFYVQDAAARLAVLAAGLEPGARVLDCCAAPGGKSFAAALAMGNEGHVLACDISEKKLPLIEAGRERLGLDMIETRAMDARRPDPALFGSFDAVIADVPCSGLGVIRKKPEIRFKNPEELAGLLRIQVDIILNISKCVKPGGVLLYATCTTRECENSGVIGEFLAENSEFQRETLSLPGSIGESNQGDITLYPHLHGTDGFYICKMRRSGI